jgi:6-phosphofructokinase 1
MTSSKKRIGILTAGGDCPGLNAAIRGIGKTAIIEHNMEVIGFVSGYTGLIHKEYITLSENQLSGILTLGGTILGTSREKPFKISQDDGNINKPELIVKNYKDLKLDCLICIGGNGTMKTAAKIGELGLNVIGIPKTIDNDVYGTDVTFGFDSAVSIATEAIDRLHTTANSHQRAMVIEVMGHDAGWIALYAGMAGGGDIILIPEIKFNKKAICEKIEKRFEEKKAYSIVVVAEGIAVPKKQTAGAYIANCITQNTGIETRETRLGYIQRGGSPTHTDRILATRYGAFAAEVIAREEYGVMVSLQADNLKTIQLSEVSGKLKLIEKDNHLVTKCRNMGISFGD